MGSVRGVLDDDEELLAQMRPHPVLLVAPAALLVVSVAAAVAIAVHFSNAPIEVAWVLVAMVALPTLWTVGRVVQWRAVRFVVTPSRLLYRRGVLRRDVVQLRLQRVAEVHLRQSLKGRLIGYGQLVFEVVGGDQPLVVEDVRGPRALQRVITAQLDRLDGAWRTRAGMGGPGTTGMIAAGGWRPGPAPGLATATDGSEAAPVPRPTGRQSWRDTPPSGVPVGAAPRLEAGSVPEQLFQLDELRRRGILSEAEFGAKKAELLSRL